MKPAGAVPLEIRPVTQRQAKAFIRAHHRHHQPPRGGVFCLQAFCPQDQTTRAVAVAGRPVARGADDGLTLEINRVASDGTPNACSILYAAVRRTAQAMGYRRVITYTLASEPGTSLRAAGFTPETAVRGRSWSCQSRPRVDHHPTQQKIRWSA